MAARILVVDRNEAFAMMLEQMLMADGGYDVQVAHTASDALALLRKAHFDLTILDMDLGVVGMSFQDLIQSVRQVRPRMRVMLIPLMGEELSLETGRFDIQGTLSKPFFADDLLPSIEDALAKQVSPPGFRPAVEPTPASPKASLPLGESVPKVQSVLVELARETTADSVLLLSTNPDSPAIVAHVSTLNVEGVGTLASLVLTMVQAAQRTAHFLGQPNAPFEHNMFEGQGMRLYAMDLSSGFLLVLVTPVTTPLGTIRHNLRRASRSLTGLALT